MIDREQHLVELVDDDGTPTGACTVAEAHSLPGHRHRAFSVLLVDPDGRLLLQQRAAAKTRFPLHWANACCGHPAPGEDVPAAAAKRLAEELGLLDVPLNEVGVHRYRANDPSTGYVEDEHDHVLLGLVGRDQPLHPDPAEVAGVRWVSPGDLAVDLSSGTDRYAPWLAGVLSAWQRAR